MQSNNNQFNGGRNFNPPALPTLTRNNMSSPNHLAQQQRQQAAHPHAQQQQFTFTQNPPSAYRQPAVHNNNNNNVGNTVVQNQQQQQQQATNQMNPAQSIPVPPINTLSLPSIHNNGGRGAPPNTARVPAANPVNYAAHRNPNPNPNQAYATRRVAAGGGVVHNDYYNNNATNSGNNNNRSVAVAIGSSSSSAAAATNAQSNGHSVPYTISNIEQDPSRKRGRAGFDPAVVAPNALSFGAPATKKQRLGDGSAMRMFNRASASGSSVSGRPPQQAIPPPLAYDSANNVRHATRASISGHSVSSQREWRQSRQSAKFKMAMDILDQFKQNHGGKLPSLRAVMKMLKVGFPKAHEILDAYAAHIGVTKEKLMQDMTVRQEKKRSSNSNNNSDSNNGSKITRGSSTRTTRSQQSGNNHHSNASSLNRSQINRVAAAPPVHNNNNNVVHVQRAAVAPPHLRSASMTRTAAADENDNDNNAVPQNVHKNLQDSICEILRCSQSGDSERTSSHCRRLESMVSDYEEFYSRLSVNDRLRLAQSYFLLGSMYREKNNRNFAYCYVERALSTFRDCNGLAAAAGYKISGDGVRDDDDEATVDEDDICAEDVGYFWPQIVEVYILGGHILLSNGQYSDAKEMYEMAHKLASKVDNELTVSEALENLAVVCMYDNDVDDSIKYTKNILSILNAVRDKAAIPSSDADIRILNARAYLACCLTLCHLDSEKESGYCEYLSVLRAAHDKFGEFDPRSTAFYFYFGFHFIAISDWKNSQKHFKYILIDCGRNRKYSLAEKNTICDLVNEFVVAVLDRDEFHENDAWLAENIEILHETHCKFANDLNCSRQKEKAIDIVQIVCNHLKIFLSFDCKWKKAKEIVNNLCILNAENPQKTQLKIAANSSYLLSSYEEIKVERAQPQQQTLKKSQIEQLNHFYQRCLVLEKEEKERENQEKTDGV